MTVLTIDPTQTRLQVYEFLASCLLKKPTSSSLHAAGALFAHLLPVMPISILEVDAVEQEYYDRLFVPMSPYFVPPFESAIRGRTSGQDGRVSYGPLMGPEACNVYAAYQAVNFDPWVLSLYEPVRGLRMPDFLGFELAFMAFLVKAQAAAEQSASPEASEQAQGWQRLQKQFLEEHLGRWVADLATLATEAGSGFYANLYQAIAAWVAQEGGCTA